MVGSFAALTLIVLAGSPSEDPTPKFIAELESIAPDAVADFKAANEALKHSENSKAAELYARVQTLAPKFAPAMRREASARSQLGQHNRAVELAEKSKAIDDSFGSDFTISLVLMVRNGPGDMIRALRALDEALRREPDDVQANSLRCQLHFKNNNAPAAEQCMEELATKFPADGNAQFFGALAAAQKGNWSVARERLEVARASGLDPATYNDFKQKLDDAEPFYERYFMPTVWLFTSWGAMWLLLIVAGAVLSALTMAEAKRLPVEKTGAAVGGSKTLHSCYSVVIFASVVFYYVSLPLVLLVVVGLGGGAIIGMLAVGHVPIKLLAIVAIVVIATVFALVKSLFVRASDIDPGHKLDPAEEPALRALLVEVAAKIGTRPVDNVYLTPGAELAVMERGSLRKRLGGDTERCLVLGVAVLEGMTVGQLRSVLAHEYGHFSNRDTAGGSLGLSVRLSLMNMARSLAESGVAAWYNPAWLFLNAFFRLFLRISQGATRLQEVLADRWAAFAYGSENFAEGLTHAIRQTIRFDAHANATIKEVVEGQKPLANLYAFAPSVAVVTSQVDEAMNEAMNREPSPYDSHPRPVDRIAWVRALGVSMPVDDAARAPAWGLFSNREALERRMTDEIRGNLAINGLVVHAEAAPVEPAPPAAT
jgi:Zn-dependent protease with chaperone function